MIKSTPKRKPKSHKTKLMKQADALLQAINRTENEHCEHCGGPNEVGHHFIRRRACADLKYDLENIIPLCQACHTNHHKDNDNINVYMERKRGSEWHDRLVRLKRESHERLNTPEQTKVNIGYYESVIERLEARLGTAEVV